MLRIVSLCWLFVVVIATSVMAEESVEVFVDKKSGEILTLINAGRAGFDENPGVLYGQMGVVLDELVDFDILSRGIMGKHYKAANDDQRAKFKQTLRDYLVEVYTKALVTFESKSIEILPLTTPATDKATVSMEVTTEDDTTFLLAYSMARADSAWQVRNIIVDGINMGLTYRNQFDSMMISNSNDMDAVIANWAAEADDEEFTK